MAKLNKGTVVIGGIILIWWYMRTTNGEGGFQWFWGSSQTGNQEAVPYTNEEEQEIYRGSWSPEGGPVML